VVNKNKQRLILMNQALFVFIATVCLRAKPELRANAFCPEERGVKRIRK